MASKVVLITGCSTGIGRSLSILLAKSTSPSYKVYATMRNLSKQQSLLDGAGDTLNKNLFVKALDVSDGASIQSVVQDILKAEGRLDVLVNNAGQGLNGPIEVQSNDEINTCMDINFLGVVRATQAAIPIFKKQESGHIINVSSVGGVNGVPFNDVYCAAKFAVEGMSEALAPVLRSFNIKVTVIEPGPVATDFAQNLPKLSPEQRAKLDSKTITIWETAIAKMRANFDPKTVQTPDDVAQIIKTAIEAEKPDFRIQTHPTARPGDAKFIDPSGSKALDYAYNRYIGN
jgi:retinol dehydrogenase-8